MQRVNFENGSYIEQGDCLELMPNLADRSVDLILCDLPYGTTACSWDSVIPFEPLWASYKRIIKPNGAIVLFGIQPFITELINSNKEMFRYDLIWKKSRAAGFLNANRKPLHTHEIILLFYNQLPTYNPQKTKGHKSYDKRKFTKGQGLHDNKVIGKHTKKHTENNGERYPTSILDFSQNWIRQKQIHPTQKPVALLEYLIKTYSNEGELVLDNTMGSGSTCVAAVKTKRNFIGFEKEAKYFDIACKRINDAYKQQTIF